MRVSESPLRDLLRLAAWYPFRWLVERLSPLAALALLRALGDAHWLLAGEQRRRLARNVLRLGPRPWREVRAAVREYFRTHYVSQLLLFVYPGLQPDALARLAEVSGLEHLDAALSLGRGAVLIQPHMGPEQLALTALALRGHRALQIGCVNEAGLSPVGRRVSLTLRKRYEARMPGEMLDARGGLLPAFRALLENGLVLCAGDGSGWEDRLGGHTPVRFCGQRVLFPTGAARMALGVGAPLLPLFVTRGRGKPFAIVIEPPVQPPAGPHPEAGMARAFARRYQRRIMAEPGSMRFLDIFEPGGLIETDAGPQAPFDTLPGSGGRCAPS